MSGYVALGVLALATLGALWLLKLRGGLLTMALAAMLFGGAGYALNGRPALPAKSLAERPDPAPPMQLRGAREAFYGRFNRVEQWAVLADSYAARGKTREAAGIYGSATRDHPRNFALWSLYGNALADHAGTLTPAAALAYDRAIELAPRHPGPRFFKALALLRSGEPEPAAEIFEALLEETPERAGYRSLIVGGLDLARQTQTGS